MESEHGSKSITNISTHPATTADEGDLSNPAGKKPGVLSPSPSSSSRSSSSSSSRDPFQDDENEPSKSTTVSRNNPLFELSSNNGPEMQSPPVQVMERQDDSSGSPYRIPASVFSTSKSTNPMEWSVTSNESLFSIHMGNMSFTRDQLLLGKSGELGMFKSGELVMPGEATTSGQLMNFSSNRGPTYNVSDIGRKSSANLDQGIGKTEAAAAETMREVIRENEVDHIREKSALPIESPLSHTISQVSEESGGASVKSFAFPILTAEGLQNSATVKVSPEQQQKQQQQQPQTPSENPAANPTAQPGWFSCFSCCPSRS